MQGSWVSARRRLVAVAPVAQFTAPEYVRSQNVVILVRSEQSLTSDMLYVYVSLQCHYRDKMTRTTNIRVQYTYSNTNAI